MNEHQSLNDDAARVDALPAAQDTTTPQRVEPVKKKKRRSYLLLVLLSLLIIAGLGGAATLLAYKYYFPTPTTQSQPAAVQESAKKLTAIATIELVKSTYTSKAATDRGISTPIKVAGYDYYTGVDQKKVIAITGSVPYADSAVVVAKIAKILKEKGFAEKIIESGNGETMYVADYTQRDVVCQTTITKTYNNPTGDHRVDVACANMNDYIAAASAQKPFYAAYPNKTSTEGSSLELIGLPKIVASKTAGYNTSQVSMGGVMADGKPGLVGGFVGLFYQTPDMKWHFFLRAQNDPPCEEYKTVDLKKAYVGMPCTDTTGKEMTVTL